MSQEERTRPGRPPARVLFSPLGLTRGSLFTAIVHTKPDRVVIVTSSQAASGVDEIIQRARDQIGQEFSYEVHTISDPFVGFVEGRDLARKLAARYGKENIVNITGGTTALQDCAQSLARLMDAKEIAVVDRRPVGKPSCGKALGDG